MNKNILAVNTGKCISLGLKILNLGSGTSVPGIVAQKISPKILSDLICQTKQEIVAVTGTNGKTTTSNFIASILKTAGRTIAHNTKGANMLTGVTTAMIEKSDLFAKLNADNSVLEADEAYLRIFANYFCADYLIVTNLFKDQADRYGEINTTARLIQEAIDKFKIQSYEMAHHLMCPTIYTSILNADDPAIQLLTDNEAIYFGFEDIKFAFNHEIEDNETVACKCGKNLRYDKTFYGKIGHYYCECGFSRPQTYLKASAEIFIDHSILNIIVPETHEEFSVRVNMPGVYNAYNALAAITFAIKIGINTNDIIATFNNYKTVFGRAEKYQLKGKNVIVQLIKNPVGAEEVLKTVKDSEKSNMLIVINDEYGDGRDVSWLWDTNFELIQKYTGHIFVAGSRCEDAALRLKYAGISTDNITYTENLKSSLKQALNYTKNDETLYILPCYTAMMELQKLKKKL